MGGVLARLSAKWMLAVYGALAVVLPGVFWLLKEPPPDIDCYEDPGPSQQAAIDDFRWGAIPLHAMTALVLLAALCAWSARHNGGAVGRPTGVATFVLAAYLAVMLVWNDAFAPLGFAALFGTFYVVPIVVGVSFVAALVVWVARPWRRDQLRHRSVAAVGWLLLLYALPLHLTVVYLKGDSPLAC